MPSHSRPLFAIGTPLSSVLLLSRWLFASLASVAARCFWKNDDMLGVGIFSVATIHHPLQQLYHVHEFCPSRPYSSSLRQESIRRFRKWNGHYWPEGACNNGILHMDKTGSEETRSCSGRRSCILGTIKKMGTMNIDKAGKI